MAQRVDDRQREVVAPDVPLPDEAHSTHMALPGVVLLVAPQLLEAHDSLAPSAEEGCQQPPVIAHEARQRTYIDISARVLPHRLGLHLRQPVVGGEAPIAQVALQLCSRHNADCDRQHQQKDSFRSVHRLQIYDYYFISATLPAGFASLFFVRHATASFRHAQTLLRQNAVFIPPGLVFFAYLCTEYSP